MPRGTGGVGSPPRPEGKADHRGRKRPRLPAGAGVADEANPKGNHLAYGDGLACVDGFGEPQKFSRSRPRREPKRGCGAQP
jgi:hypothetical protein